MISRFFHSIAMIAGIVLFRFALVPRMWALVVIAVNAASLAFLHTVYGQVTLISVTVGIVVMAYVYAKHGFVRLLGIGHFLWLGMLPWLAFELPQLESSTWLFRWIVCLLAINSICLIVDAIDVARYFAGDRQPHYAWEQSNAV